MATEKMMDEYKRKLSLHEHVTYQIEVPGELDQSWSEWNGKLKVIIEREGDDTPITTLTGTFVQAGLHSLLRRFYALGLPIISVNCIDCG